MGYGERNSPLSRYETVPGAVTSLVWPVSCLYCGRRDEVSAAWLCDACWTSLLGVAGGDYCPRCGCDASPYALVEGACPRCLGRPLAWDTLVRCGRYGGLLASLILAFKHDRTELEPLLAFLVRQARQGAECLDAVDFWVPVPLHWTRRLVRGYNQAGRLARVLATNSGRVNRALRRVRRTRFQPTVATPRARARNVAGAFALRRGADVSGATVGIVDDIKTSGATLGECARVLRAAGAVRVHAVVLAVAG